MDNVQNVTIKNEKRDSYIWSPDGDSKTGCYQCENRKNSYYCTHICPRGYERVD